MYKLFKITYNSGFYCSRDLPCAYYIAQNEEEVIAHSKRYKEFIRHKEIFGGEIWVTEVDLDRYDYCFENLRDFNINFTRKGNYPKRLDCFAAIRTLFCNEQSMKDILKFFDEYKFINDDERRILNVQYYIELPYSVAEKWLKDTFKYLEDDEKLVFITQFPEIKNYLN